MDTINRGSHKVRGTSSPVEKPLAFKKDPAICHNFSDVKTNNLLEVLGDEAPPKD